MARASPNYRYWRPSESRSLPGSLYYAGASTQNVQREQPSRANDAAIEVFAVPYRGRTLAWDLKVHYTHHRQVASHSYRDDGSVADGSFRRLQPRCDLAHATRTCIVLCECRLWAPCPPSLAHIDGAAPELTRNNTTSRHACASSADIDENCSSPNLAHVKQPPVDCHKQGGQGAQEPGHP